MRTQDVARRLAHLGEALLVGDAAAAAALFAPNACWRDLVAFSWNLTTCEGRDEVQRMLAATLARVRPRDWRIEGEATADEAGVTSASFSFETSVGRCEGSCRLTREGIFYTMLTALSELRGFEESAGPRRPRGVEHVADPRRMTWTQRRAELANTLGFSTQPYVLIIGGGQAGIGLAARLRRLGVPTLIVEKNGRAGDSWRNRYESLCLHDPVWYDHMPYMSFPDDWPVFCPKDKMGDWLESYARLMELSYWPLTEAVSAAYDEAAGEWAVQVRRAEVSGSSTTLTLLRPKQLVLATGMSGKPNIPSIAGLADFGGQVYHSSAHRSSAPWKGKRCVVIGSNNSAHDICADLWEHGAEVAMVQRSSTCVVRSVTLLAGMRDLYSEEAAAAGLSTHAADMAFASTPYCLLPKTQIPVYEEHRRRDAEFYARLERSGFRLDFGEDGSGLFCKYLRRGSGYYIDVGASELVASGQIRLIAGEPTRITEGGVVVAGEEHPAELIVLATGFGSMVGWAAELISPAVADKVGKVWGLGSGTKLDPGPWEAELRNMWKPTHQHGLWFHGGNLHQARHYSIYLALQLKARMEGLDTPVYGMQPVHHKR